jgi:hypothetical protein
MGDELDIIRTKIKYLIDEISRINSEIREYEAAERVLLKISGEPNFPEIIISHDEALTDIASNSSMEIEHYNPPEIINEMVDIVAKKTRRGHSEETKAKMRASQQLRRMKQNEAAE